MEYGWEGESDSDKVTAKSDYKLYTTMSNLLVFLSPKRSHFQAWLHKGKREIASVWSLLAD